MKKLLLSLFSLIFLTTGNIIAQEDCNADAGSPQQPVTEICNDGSNSDDLFVDKNSVGWSGTTDYLYVVTQAETEFIVGVSEDGTFDFSENPKDTINNPPLPYPDGDYCFHGFAYNQAELDVITANAAVQFFLPCLAGGESFEELLVCAEANFDTITIELIFDNVIDSIIPILNLDICVDLADPYCMPLVNSEVCNPAISSIDVFGNDNLNFSSFDIFPNPVSTFANIRFYAKDRMEAKLEVYDISGKVIQSNDIVVNNGLNTQMLPLDNLSNGVYWMNICNESGKIRKKFIVNK